LLTAFTKRETNYLKGFIFNNEAFTIGLRGNILLNELTWTENFDAENKPRYYNLTFDKVFDGDGILKREFLDTFHINPRGEFAKQLKRVFSAAKTRYGNNIGRTEKFEQLINRVKKVAKLLEKF
jgi:hypothetical protein